MNGEPLHNLSAQGNDRERSRLALLVEHARQELRLTCMESTRALVAAVEAKDPHSRLHSHTVSRYAVAIAHRMGLSSSMVQSVGTAALLHDIGKIGIPDAILTKPGPLTAEERRIVERHPEAALEIIGHVSFLAAERPFILHHHERFDGTGYPSKLKGMDIPLGARIIALADALDAMFSTRSYKPAYDMPRVRAEISKASGGQFDPDMAQAALSMLHGATSAALTV